MRRILRQRYGPSLRAAACGLIVGALAAGCEPPPTESDNEQLTRAQEATPLRDEERPAGQRAQRPGAASSNARPAAARAVLEPTAGNEAHGAVEFEIREGGGLTMVAMLEGLEPGPHGFHVHEVGDCTAPDASSAQGHFAPEGDPHGSPSDPPESHHAGDFGNVNADDAGVAMARFEDDELALDGEFGIIGRAVIVHADRDDLRTQPDGNAGDPVACGVIRDLESEPRRQVG